MLSGLATRETKSLPKITAGTNFKGRYHGAFILTLIEAHLLKARMGGHGDGDWVYNNYKDQVHGGD